MLDPDSYEEFMQALRNIQKILRLDDRGFAEMFRLSHTSIARWATGVGYPVRAMRRPIIRFAKRLEEEASLVLAIKIIGALNEYLKLDPEAIQALVENRVPVNESLADHPTVQVNTEGPEPVVGMLGILNGILGNIPGTNIGYITAHFDDYTKELIHFSLSKPEAYTRKETPSETPKHDLGSSGQE